MSASSTPPPSNGHESVEDDDSSPKDRPRQWMVQTMRALRHEVAGLRASSDRQAAEFAAMTEAYQSLKNAVMTLTNAVQLFQSKLDSVAIDISVMATAAAGARGAADEAALRAEAAERYVRDSTETARAERPSRP